MMAPKDIANITIARVDILRPGVDRVFDYADGCLYYISDLPNTVPRFVEFQYTYQKVFYFTH